MTTDFGNPTVLGGTFTLRFDESQRSCASTANARDSASRSSTTGIRESSCAVTTSAALRAPPRREAAAAKHRRRRALLHWGLAGTAGGLVREWSLTIACSSGE